MTPTEFYTDAVAHAVANNAPAETLEFFRAKLAEYAETSTPTNPPTSTRSFTP